MASILKVDTIQDQDGNNIINESGDTITIGASGDTITVPTGASLTVPNGGLSGQNYPAFSVYNNNSQSIPDASFTKIQFTQELFDTDSAFDSTTNYRFTPQVAGKYFFHAHIRVQTAATYTNYQGLLYKNGSVVARSIKNKDGTINETVQVSHIIDLNGSTDYVEAFVYQNAGSAKILDPGVEENYFIGFRIGA